MTENVIDNLLRRILDVTGIATQSELAQVLEINRSAITHARNNNRIPDKWILKLYRKYKLNPEWVESGIGRTFLDRSSESDIEFEQIPRVNAVLSAGGGSFEIDETVDEYVSFSAKWLASKGAVRSMVVMSVSGDSMEPEIRAGDTVLIDRGQDEVINRKIYAVGIEDTIFIKRVEKHPGKLVLCSDNRAYAPIYVGNDDIDKVRIIGRVLWSSREYR